jgi:murein DD-endopeptidase MepM/ murein hydrolase activator NlpD
MAFPLPFVPKLSWKTGGRYFGALRSDGRKHAACDLIAPKGTEIFAVDDGIVIRGPYPFHHGTDAIEVQHTFFIVRYAEILKPAPGIGVGTHVTQGAVIGYVGKMYRDSMLHFEMYDGSGSGPLTVRSNKPYQRRSDLMDPTPYLDYWSQFVLMSHAHILPLP